MPCWSMWLERNPTTPITALDLNNILALVMQWVIVVNKAAVESVLRLVFSKPVAAPGDPALEGHIITPDDIRSGRVR